MNNWTIDQLRELRESEDHIEYKAAEHGNFAYDGGNRVNPKERRKCILGYITALCNEGGGTLVLGMHDKYPHRVLGTLQNLNALGQLESSVYRDSGIRPHVYELYEDVVAKKGRVLVIEVDGRPVGKLFRFEDVPLMRVGEELLPMSDEQIFSIMNEHEPDFSAEICKGLKFSDLDLESVHILKEKYAKKQKNPSFLTLTDRQALSDLHLISGTKITYAALILVGTEEALKKYLPQAAVVLEFRKSESLIPYDNRQVYIQPFYKMIEQIWRDINLRNSKIDINEASYIFNLPYFNEEVTRESINNAITHRSYRRTSETVIKLYPELFVVTSAGGFPLGVTLDNILKVPSTPRNRLLAEVLASTGVVERSGQGVDKIYRLTLSEGKQEPDYSHSDDFMVELRISAAIKDVAFARFIDSEQRDLADEDKLSVFEVIGLDKIRQNRSPEVSKDIITKLLARKMIEKRGRTSSTHYILSKNYFEICGKSADYSKMSDWNTQKVMPILLEHFASFRTAKMKDIATLLEPQLTRRQVRSLVESLVKKDMLTPTGAGSGTTYSLSDNFLKSSAVLSQAISLGFEEMKKRGMLAEDGQKDGQKPSKSDDLEPLKP